MPLGPFGEVLGTTGTLDSLPPAAQNYKSKVIAPRNPKVVSATEAEFRLTPSKYQFDMSMDTQHRLDNMRTIRRPRKIELLDMGETSLQKYSGMMIDEPMFQPFPSEIFFQKFEPFKTYEVPLILRNNDKVPRLVKVSMVNSPYFKIIAPNDVGHKVGPGLPTTFRILFTPEEKKDYIHELICITEREKFVVPVKAIGARAILDFPDSVHFDVSPVKYSNTKTLLVTNVGNREAKFTLHAEKPFHVNSEIATLPVGEAMQVNIDFCPLTAGDHKKHMVLHYDTGEDIFVELYGAAQDASVRLDKNSIRVENTFISMANQRVVTINNRSDVIAHFRWTEFASQEEEDQRKTAQRQRVECEEKSDTDKFLEECVADPTLRDKISILGRTFKNRKTVIQNDNLLFNSDVIKVEPVSGDIWPNSSYEVTVVFKPREAKVYTQTIYCDITGRESRLPLRIRGDGMGPKVQFSFERLDMGNIFIGSTHYYEVILANKGDIDTIYSVLPKSTTFGSCFHFNPAEGIIMPGGHQAIQVVFKCGHLGNFEETFEFQIDGANEKEQILFVGSVVGPTFHFDVPKLKFGTVSYGFLNTEKCKLLNTSLVPMTFTLRVPGDGTENSICSTSDLESEHSQMGVVLHGPPREFQIIPPTGTLPPRSEVNITVNFISNTIKKYDMALVVDVENVGEEVVTLPISAKCIVPGITVMTPILDYGRCFLRHPYMQMARLQNETDLPAKYELVPWREYPGVLSPMKFRSPQPKGIIPPQSVCEVPLVIEPECKEEQDMTAYIAIFGSPEPPLPVHLACVGEGPVVFVTPTELEWGVIPVLSDVSKTLILSNESLIPATFQASMLRPDTAFRVEPQSGEIPPEHSMELTITAHLNDACKFQDKINLDIKESALRQIPVTGTGHGTTIVSNPPLDQILDLGPNFSNRVLHRTVKLCNMGRRHQQLVWSIEGGLPPSKSNNSKDPKKNHNKLSTFRVFPPRMNLLPGECVDLNLEGFVENPCLVKERLLCHAIIGRSGGKECIIKTDVQSEFINPLLEFSTKSVFFRVDKAPDDQLEIQKQNLIITNVSSLPLTVGLKLASPFSIQHDGGEELESEIILGVNERHEMTILFDPAYKDDCHSRTVNEVLSVNYKEHPHVDYVALRGEVYFPNLNFERSVVNFGCILNDTEVTRYVNVTNSSPMDVKYKWSFLIDAEPCTKFNKRPRPFLKKVVEEEWSPSPPLEGGQETGGEPHAGGGETDVLVIGDHDDHTEGAHRLGMEPIMEFQTISRASTCPSVEADEEEDTILLKDSEGKGSPVTPDNREADERIPSPLDIDQPEKGQLELEEGPEKGVAKEMELRLLESPDYPEEDEPLQTNRALSALMDQDDESTTSISIEEIFDILPLYGTLKPGDTIQTTFTFFGHADIWGQVKAICEVEGGPTYELQLCGEASVVEYSFDSKNLDFGRQMYDQVASGEIILCNKGKVGFSFTALNMDPALSVQPKAGVPSVMPRIGYIDPFTSLKLVVSYLPGKPENFQCKFQIQVAHFEPDTIMLHGEGVFPRVSLDLPRMPEGDETYLGLLKTAKENLIRNAAQKTAPSARSKSGAEGHDGKPHPPAQEYIPSDLEVQMEVERLYIIESALSLNNASSDDSLAGRLAKEQTFPESSGLEHGNQESPSGQQVVPEPVVFEVSSCRELGAQRVSSREQQTASAAPSQQLLPSTQSSKTRVRRTRPKLPPYILDFGYVVLGSVRTHVVRATNTGWFPASFQVNRENVHQMGFQIELDRVRNLPGAPDHETVDFLVRFDPRAANLPLGSVESVVSVSIVNGPQIRILLRAVVTMPDMQISDDTLDFGDVKCGECKVITVQLHNHQFVRCEWNSQQTLKERKKADKRIPMHLRRKLKAEKKKPLYFEVMPPTGSLLPGQRTNVQVKFMPTEEKYYEVRIPLRIAQSSQRILLLCRGQGLEPRLDFDRNVVEFGPILPHSTGDEQDIIVRNPCSFPIEFYNLEFDSSYLEEEKVLRLMKPMYDEYHTILLPPRRSGEKLPAELLNYYEDQMKRLEEIERTRREELAAAETTQENEEEGKEEGAGKEDDGSAPVTVLVTDSASQAVSTLQVGEQGGEGAQPGQDAIDRLLDEDGLEAKDSDSTTGVGELEITPVSKAIARHLGIDLSPEGKAARNRRGIAILLHGAPMSGKTSTAVMLAKLYETALLTVDGVVLDAIANGSTPAGLKARELCAEAARKRAEETRVLEGEELEKKTAGGLSVEAVTAHTQGGVVPPPPIAHSTVSNRKTSTISEQKKPDKHQGKTINASSVDGATGSQVPSSPPPLAAPIARRLSISASVAGEEGLMSCVLPEELLVEILAERLQLNDCHRGVVFDGLETLFSQNMFTTANCILKALNNRRFIYFVTLKLDYNILKEQERKEQEEKELKLREQEEMDKRRLEEMSEEEYDALNEDEKAEIDRKRLILKKERMKREQAERQERERREREAREEEMRRQEEDSRARRGRKKQASDGVSSKGEKADKKTPGGPKGQVGASQERVNQRSQGGTRPHAGADADPHPLGKTGSSTERPESHQTEKSDTQVDEGKKKKEKGGKGKDSKGKDSDTQIVATEEKPIDPAELLLMQRFRTFEHSLKDIQDLTEFWDRSTLQPRRPPTPSDRSDEDGAQHPPSGKKGKGKDKHDKEKEKEKERQRQLERERELAEKAAREAALAVAQADGVESLEVEGTEDLLREKREEEMYGVPHIAIDCSDKSTSAGQKLLETHRLPNLETVLDGLGLGPRGPPIPPPAVFAVVPYPVKRKAPPLAEFGGHYAFIAASPFDPNVIEERPKEVDMEEEKSVTPDKGTDHPTPTKGKGGKDKGRAGAATSQEQRTERKRSADRKKVGRRGSVTAASSPPPGAGTPVSDVDGQSASSDISPIRKESKTRPHTPSSFGLNKSKEVKIDEEKEKEPLSKLGKRLSIFRWIVPANGEVALRLRFQSEELGQFDQTMNFEIVGTRRRYQLYCRGVCSFPTLSREPRIVFPSRKKNKRTDEVVQKKYILMTEIFEFGPLLVGKSRDRYREGKYPENMEKFTILNTSPLEADVNFCFLNDSQGTTYLLEPPSMVLKPNESQQLTVWAYPKVPGAYEDAVVCCVRENPEPIVFKINCLGFRPELELDKKVLHFDRVLLHRKDTKTIYLRNSTQLPVAWKLSGLENLGDDFTVACDSGIVEPLSEYPLHAYFRAMKPVQTSKKMIRLEISDVDNIMGIVNTEPIQVIAEAYDVALDMSFPKGTDGGLDFGTIRVSEETKQTCTLKNKGKYEIAYNFVFEDADPSNPEAHNLFSVIPSKGNLSPLERPTQVQVIFKSQKEIAIKDMPLLKCQVIEPSLGSGGEIIASIPVKVSVKAVFSRFRILPASDINFGSLLVNSKKTRTFVIENKGEFDFKYTITKMMKESVQGVPIKNRPVVKGDKGKSRDGSSSALSQAKPKKAESISSDESELQVVQSRLPRRETLAKTGSRQDAGTGQSRLVLGMFTIWPAFGIILPNGHQTITVDCIAESQGRSEEDISIDVTEKDPRECTGGIPYKLIAEACIPSINIDDIGHIFEEHRVCKNLSAWQNTHHQVEAGGIYGEEEKKFVFNNVIVGRKAKARFKISNTNKVPCDIVLSLKAVTTKGAPKMPDVFEVEPTRAQIPNHSHLYVTISFTPPSMQMFSAMFEASIEGVSQNQARGKPLSFEVCGEGNLPRITIARPNIRNKRGQPLILFKRNLLSRTETHPLVLLNDGTLPSKVDIDLIDPDGAFMLRPSEETHAIVGSSLDDDDFDGEKRLPHTACVVVGVGETATFNVTFRPSASQRYQAHVRLSVTDNQYEDSVVQLVGEGYEDDISIDDITSASTFTEPENEEGNMADDDVQAAKSNLMKFGDCYVNEPRHLTLTLTNHSGFEPVRFQWPEHAQLKFSPTVGHLHPNSHKQIAVTFKSDAPASLEEIPVPCRIIKINFEKPISEVPDWDDRIQVVKWVDILQSPLQVSDSLSKSRPSSPQFQTRPGKKKIVETEAEPAVTEVPESMRQVELLLSGTCDYCQFTCSAEEINFRETLMFQTRVFEITLTNTGKIQMDFSWSVVMDSFSPTLQRSVTFMSEGERPESRIEPVDTSYVPFSVEPQYGTLLPGRDATFKVKFAPLDINNYEGRLFCSVPNLMPDAASTVLNLRGKSSMPYCHFELKDSDYITGARRNPEMRGPGGAPPGSTLDPNTRVIEFNCIGLGVHKVKEFGIINPTNTQFSFVWVCEDETDPKTPSCFKCLTPRGEVRPGRKFKVSFEFVSSQLDVMESFWRFTIPEQNITVPFLLVGFSRDPDVTLDRSHLNFKALLIGRQAMETVYLTNNEDEEFEFSVVEDSCHSEGYSAHLEVQPMHGWLRPNSSLPVNLYFSPNSDKEVNFNLVINIKRKQMPVTLNVKAEGYCMNCSLLCEDSAGNRVQLSENGVNQINFGEVEVNEQAVRIFYIHNNGKFNFDYYWEINERFAHRSDLVQVQPLEGGVMHGEKQKCMLLFCPPSRMSLRGCEIALKISNGPTYAMQVLGSGVTPGLHFSFHTYNFGSCFLYRPGLPEKSVKLKLTNKDRKEISVDCLYTPTNHLHHNFEAGVIAPNESVDVTFTFYPRETTKYHETVTFEINGLSKHSVEIYGTGTEMRIEVAHPRYKVLNLGARFVKDVVKRYVPIVNHSPAPISFNLALTPTSTLLQQPDVLSISPSGSITLEPKGGSAKVEVSFKPRCRIPQFTEEVMLECAGIDQPLFVVKGSCLGMEISLDTDAIPFGAVVQRSQSVRKLVMSNTGDMNAKFSWDIEKFRPDFSISPVEGCITPGMEVTFDVTFHPQDINQDIRYEKLRCRLEGNSHKPVLLTLTGMCTGVPPVKEQQSFTTNVRQRETKYISIANRTNQLWNLKPIIDGEFWTGPVMFLVEPQQTKQYELAYRPLTMTTEGKKHQGSIFFPLPDGTGLMYNLLGTAEPPKPNAKIQRDVPCKTSYTETLSVSNWLKKPQRFRVKTEPLKPDRFDPGTTLKGMEYIDVPASSKKDYRLTFYAYREGTTTMKVTFTNETTNEYQFYELTFRATRPGVIATIDLTTPVRQSIQHMIELENPLSQQVIFNASCPVPEILMPSQLSVPAHTKGQFNFEYQPLKVGETQGRLEFTCNDLGLYQYDLNLKASPAGPEKALYFRTCLGQNQISTAKFLNFAKQKTDYTCKVDNGDFHVDKTVAAAPGSTGGTEVALDVTFEPSRLGEQRATLTVTSALGGEYTFPLFGACVPPKPQGPFIIKAGATTPITFRNVFNSTTPFTFQVDNPLFHLTKTGETIRAHKDHRIVVGFDGNDSGSKSAVMGKLVVTCSRSAGGNSNVQWVYYLKGVTP